MSDICDKRLNIVTEIIIFNIKNLVKHVGREYKVLYCINRYAK